MVYNVAWKKGTRYSAKAERVSEELNSLYEKTPENALELAKDSKTELHKCATWDDAKAATKYRLDEMRRVIRSIVIIEKKDENDENPIIYRQFEYVKVETEDEEKEEDEENGKNFVVTREALRVSVFRDQIMNEIKQGIYQLAHKAKIYQHLADEDFSTVQYHLGLANEAIKI